MEINIKLEDGILKFNHQFRVKDGRPTTSFSPQVKEFITSLEDGEYEMTIQPLEMAKTNQQNKYIHKLFDMYAEEHGCTAASTKLACKEMFGLYTVHKNPITGEYEKDWESFRTIGEKRLSEVIKKWFDFLIYEAKMNIPTAEEFKNGEV